jgi:peptidyl-dipeptidase A
MNTDAYLKFLRDYLAVLEPLSRDINIAYWNASISGREKDFNRFADLQVKLQHIHSDKRAYDKILTWKMDASITDPITKREIEVLYNDFHRHQIDSKLDERITKLASSIENQFNVHRASLSGTTITNNEILQILKRSDDSEYRRQAWQASKEAGAVVHNDLISLVKLRNEAAQALGYDTFYSLALDLAEQDETSILTLFDELESFTAGPYEEMKKDVDDFLAARFHIPPDQIRPWHYEDPFFQEAPRIFNVDLDKYYEGHDILRLVTDFYNGLSIYVEDILERSDLFEKPGKVQHAFCTDIDRKGDVRILANIRNDETWAGTMLHELGHAIYIKHTDSALPYLLREEAHIFTTEAVAMLFGRLSKDASWIQTMLDIPESEKEKIQPDLDRNSRLSQLIFARWCQVMLRFERELYRNPDQDLNSLWWQMVERYQKITPPEDITAIHWASKIHIVSAPVYYHNYMLGELLASQLNHCIQIQVMPPNQNRLSICNDESCGQYLKKKIFQVGARYKWDKMIELATGESLTPRYYIDQFVR